MSGFCSRSNPSGVALDRLRDATDYQALVAERGGDVPALEDISGSITRQLATTGGSGIALLAATRLIEIDVIGYCGLVVHRTDPDEPEIAFELQGRVPTAGTRRRRPVPS